MNKFILLLNVLLLSISTLVAQNIVSVELLESRTKQELVNEFGSIIAFGADLYRATYETPDIYGVLDTASGLFVYPVAEENNRVFPMLIYQHGTVGSRDDVPSLLQGGYSLAVFWAGVGYATTAADFLGLGTARGFHPYVHSRTEASAAIDMHLAVKDYANANDLLVNSQLFITGYSQGGHAAAAAQKAIQEDHPELNVKASAPMSGPYSISGIMRDLMLGDEAYNFVAYAPYSILSYNLEYNVFENTNEVFKEPVATWVQQFYDEEIDLGTLNEDLIDWLITNHGASIPKYMFQDAFITEIESDPDHPANQALRDNDLINWAPSIPTRLYYCTADDQVPFMNSLVAKDSMTAAGSSNVLAIDVASDEDHGGCVEPAVTAGYLFFSFYQSIGTVTNTIELDETLSFDILPNPANERLDLRFRSGNPNFESIELLNIAGQQLRIVTGETSMDLNGIVPGAYLVRVNTDKGVWIEKLIVQ
jgi:hypothetical protein